MENGTRPEYQLAPEGEVRHNQLDSHSTMYYFLLEENSIPHDIVRICYSSFSRTTHTAQVVASVLNIPFEGAQCKVMENLRERFFDPLMRPAEGGESVDDVACRLAEAMETMESQFQGCTILVVSHSDTLQILLTILSAAKLNVGSGYTDLSSRIQAV
ncbi:unnamed protein product [Malus baccata var. baccata]